MESMGIWAAALVGLLGGVHCVGMCGGIVGALTFGLPVEQRASRGRLLPLQLAYNLGRITSYTLAGAIMGGLGFLLAQLLPVYAAQRALLVVAGLFMVGMGLYLGGWWYGVAVLERAGGVLWRRIEPFAKRLLPVSGVLQAWALGIVWGWIPCGLVYSVLVWTVSSGGVVEGASLMLAFGLGTLPNLLVVGFAAAELGRWLHKIWVRRLAGGSMIGLGLVTIWQAL